MPASRTRLSQRTALRLTIRYLSTLATGLVNVGTSIDICALLTTAGMTIPGIWAVERFGRRKYLMAGALWMSLMQLVIAIAYTAAPDADSSKKILCVVRAR